MITEDQALGLLTEANPVPDASALDVSGASPTARLDEYDARSRALTEIKYEPLNVKPISGRRRVAGIAAAIAALVVAGAFLLRTTDEPPVTDQPATAAEVATAFVEAYGSFDVDLASRYLAADVDLSQLDGGQQEWRLGNRWLQATGPAMLVGTCEELGSPATATSVRCPFDYYGLRSNEIGLGPYSGSYFDLTLDDGEVTSVAIRWEYMGNGFSQEMWVPFADWVATNYPEDVPTMYQSGITSQRWTEESIDLWEQHSQEYVEERIGQTDEATIGLLGLPPEGATPSTPENGELVASMWEHIGAPGDFGNGWLYLYADGRLIWEQADPNPTGGWLEQRLTPEGVELIRSEIIASGLFDADQPPPPANDGFPRETNGGWVQVRNGDRLVYVNRVVPELMERLADLWSWLPDSAWEDTEAKPYVPSHYAMCMQMDGFVNAIDPTDHLFQLPTAAQDLLAGAGQLHSNALVDLDPAGLSFLDSSGYCYHITIAEARDLAITLDHVVVPSRESEGIYVVSKPPGDNLSDPWNGWILLGRWPMLPHGVPAFTGA